MKIAFLHEQDGNCSEWRCNLPGTVLQSRGHDVRQYHIFQPWPNEILEADVVVVQRPTAENHLEHINQLKKLGMPIVVEIDDNFMDGALQPDNPAYFIFHPKVIASKGSLGEWQFDMQDHVVNTKRKILLGSIKSADVLTTTTPLIAQAYKDISRVTRILPNCWDASNPIWQTARKNRVQFLMEQSATWQREHNGVGDDPFLKTMMTTSIAKLESEVWILFSGSFTHLGDFKMVDNALRTITAKYPNVRFVVGGDPRIQSDVARVPDNQYAYLGFREFKEYPLLVAQADIVLAPLKDSRFNSAKSDIRLMEAGNLGIPWIGSPLPTYKEWGVGGLFADRAHDWIRGLSRLVEMTPEERRALAAPAKEKAQKRSIQNNIEKWEETYVEVIQKVGQSRGRGGLEALLQGARAG